MATNPFFQNYSYHGEQQVYDDLIVEYIKLAGQDMYYVPRKEVARDMIFGEDTNAYYDKAYLVELFIRSVDGFEGDGSFVSKFGLEIRDQVTFTIAKRRFDEEIGTVENIIRPREGDLLFFPMNQKLFKIMYVDNKPFFYPFGTLHTYDLFCENFEYTSETFTTGIPEIDSIMELSQDQYQYAIFDEEGKAIFDENGLPILMDTYDPDVIDPIDDSDDLGEEGDTLIDWSVVDPFSEGRY